MFLLIWPVLGSIVSLFSPAYAQPVHLPLVHHVLPHSDTAVTRSFLSVERRNRMDASLSLDVSGVELIPISFGTPTQTLSLVLSLSLPGTLISGCEKTCSGGSVRTVFNYTKSSSARNKSTSTQTIQVDNTSTPGSVFTDVISLGPFSVLDASFFMTDPSSSFYNEPGVFGLGFPSASFQNLPTLWQSLLSSNPVDAPEMGIWLSRVHNTSTVKALTPGVFTFGGTNSSLYTGDIEFLDLTSTSAWVLNITIFTIQGHELTLTQSRNDVAFNMETQFLYGPTSSVAAIWAQVPGASLLSPGSYTYPCSTTLNVSVSFGGRSWTLDPAELNRGPGELPEGQCLGAIIGMDQAEDQPGWIFGDAFLRGVYTVLRQGNPPAVGFAELSEQGGGAPSPTLPSTASSGSMSLSSSSIITPQSSTPPPVSAKKSPVAAVVGGVVGGLVLCAALLVALLLTRRRRQQNYPTLVDEDEGGVIRDLTPEPLVTVDQRQAEMAPLMMEQLRSLTEEVRRLTERDTGRSLALPCYHPDT